MRCLILQINSMCPKHGIEGTRVVRDIMMGLYDKNSFAKGR